MRPVRWLLALLGDSVVPVSFAGKASGNITFGHRVLSGDRAGGGGASGGVRIVAPGGVCDCRCGSSAGSGFARRWIACAGRQAREKRELREHAGERITSWLRR